MRELLSNNSLFVGQLYEDTSLALRARDFIFFTTDLQTVNHYSTIHCFLNLFRHHTLIKHGPYRINPTLKGLCKQNMALMSLLAGRTVAVHLNMLSVHS